MNKLIIFVGFPASGKSTYYRENFVDAGFKLVSKDLMGSNKVKQQAQLLEQHFTAGANVVLDNTNLSVEERAQAISIAKKHNANIQVNWFDTSFEECMERNSKREGKAKVPKVAMYGMRKRFKEPDLSEGIDSILKINSPKKADLRILRIVPNLSVSTAPRPAIFLDKDGVLVNDDDYPYIVPKSTLLPGVEEALISLAKLDMPIVVISNQAWVAKGRMTMQEVEAIFAELKQKAANCGGRIDGTYFCPHQTKDKCECRKPGIGMLKQAAKDFNIDLSKSTLVGDMETDIQCGQNGGLSRTVLVKNGIRKDYCNPTYIFEDLLQAVKGLYDVPHVPSTI